MFALFIYVAAIISSSISLYRGAINCSRLLLAHPCWLHSLPGSISLACTKKPHSHPCWAALPALPCLQTLLVCHGNGRAAGLSTECKGQGPGTAPEMPWAATRQRCSFRIKFPTALLTAELSMVWCTKQFKYV